MEAKTVNAMLYLFEQAKKGFLRQSLYELYDECEHGDEEHRKWLKDKFEDFLNRKYKEIDNESIQDSQESNTSS